ncbi:hypothetical protein H4P12_08860 [Paracoccus sp. 11-3]|uniref:Peptidoglycan binding protein n=1 Tax=Paracoccus amoyensis TaxID=2760093 RepID=A0A926JB76_9RHOB|nr:hypothetical protein [Paracoccus amoyensis]MBC9246821.1 hypothetical protein [Paracoccus amoyensis]
MTTAKPVHVDPGKRAFGKALILAGALAICGGAAQAQNILALRVPLPQALSERLGGERVISDPADIPSTGHLLIYAQDLGDDPRGLVAALPANALLVVGDCAAGLQLEGIGPVAAQIAVPNASEDCDAAALADAFVNAATLSGDADGRTELLESGGYQVIGRGAPVRISGAASAGGLVISALPMETVAAASSEEVVLVSLGSTSQFADPAPFAAVDEAQPRAGLPEPSIIIGDMAVLMAAGDPGPLGMPFAAREAVRQRDPAMFARLVAQGAFDPEDTQTTQAIQTELARMHCYVGSVDGQWGGGSSRAVDRYIEAGGPAGIAAQSPDVQMFRALISAEDITCPEVAPVAAADPPRDVRSNTSSRSTSNTTPRRNGGSGATTTRRPAATTSTAPAQQQSTGRRQINPGILGLGNIR